MLEFICGADACGKSEEIYRRAKLDAEQGKTVFILVPEQYSMYSEREMLDRLGLSAQNKIQILTFSRLCNMIFARKGPLKIKYIDNAGKYMLTRKAINNAKKELTFLSSNTKQHGFAKLVSTVISEFKRYGVSHTSLLAFADKVDDSRLKTKLLDLTAIYRHFDALIESGYSNAEDNLSLIVDKIPHCDFISGIFYIDFFRSFTPVEYDVLSQIMKKADVCVSLCTDTLSDSSSIFCSQINTYNKLCRIAKQLDIQTKTPFFYKDNQAEVSNEEINHLKNNFFLPNPAPSHGNPKSVHIHRPDNIYNEVSECAMLINRLCRTENKSLNDFLILTGSLDNYERIIPPLFEKFGIKYFLDKKIPLTESPLIRAILAVLEILAFGFSYERVMNILRSGYFACSREDVDVFENYILATGISHKLWNSREPWQYNPDNSFDIDIINQIRQDIIFPILDFSEMFVGRKTIKDICNGLFLWLKNINMPEAVDNNIKNFSSSTHPELAEQLRLVWNSLVSVNCQLSDCLGKDQATFVDFYELFSSVCAELSVGMTPQTQDKVIISEANHFRSTGNKIVIVLGVCDNVFPQSRMSEGLISDSERVSLAKIGLELAPDEYSRQKEDQFLIYSIFATAKEHLYLFSPISDRDGKPLVAAEMIFKIKNKIFPDLKFGKKEFEGKQNIFETLVSKLFENNWNIQALPDSWKQAYSYFLDSPEYSKRLKNLYNINLSRDEDDEISLITAEKLYGTPLILSVSKLEKYNACAFSFFMRYGLLAKERLLSGFKAADMGTVLHAVLCDYFKEKSSNDTDFSKISHESCLSEINSLVEKHASAENNNLYSSSWHYKYITMRIKSIATATAWKLINFYAQSSFKPKDFEISFGRNGVLPPYKLQLSSGSAFLEGFIDRIDEMDVNGEKYISVFDYKSSEKTLNPELADAGVSFQPLLYATAICENSDDLHPAAMFYMHMTDPILKLDETPDKDALERELFDKIKINGIVLDIPEIVTGLEADFNNKDAIHYVTHDAKSYLTKLEFDSRLQKAKEKATSSAEKIISGNIEIKPLNISGFDPCSYCPYGEVCKK